MLFAAVVSGVLSEQELRKGLEDAWTTCGWPGLAADHEVWVHLFKSPGVEEDHFLNETELQERSRLPESVRLYRAATEGHQTGLSWTTSFERAHWFGTRLGPIAGHPQQIYETQASREAVLATFHATRREHEYVIDTGRIQPIMPVVVDPARWEELLNTGDTR